MLYHVECTHSPDFLALRDRVLPDSRTCRQAHVALHIGRGDRLVAAGPRVDGAGAHLFYDAPDEPTLARWLHDDPYADNGVWLRMAWSALPVSVRAPARTAPRLDGSRRAWLVAGPLDAGADDPGGMARAVERGALVGGGVDAARRFVGWFGGGREDALAAAADLGLPTARAGLVELVWAL